MAGEAPGSARLVLARNVTHLNAEQAVFAAMLEGWARQQRARFLDERGTIAPRLRVIRGLAQFTNLYPWQWDPSEAEAWASHKRSGERPVMLSTLRGYEITVRLFCEYLLDPAYGWVEVCRQHFGMVPQQIFHEGNSVLHVAWYEGDPRRRPLSYDEIQALFDAADAIAERKGGSGRKGTAAALRDSAALKTCYAFGLRRSEVSFLDVVDLARNAHTPQFGKFGRLSVRYGKASRGGPPNRRTVLLVAEMDWVVEVLDHYLTEVRPALGPGRHPALWVSERRTRLSPRRVNDAFVAARQEAGLDPNLDLHCLRHSFVTHLIEFGYPDRFVQEQVGHAHASTTAIYTGVSEEYRNMLLQKALQGRLGHRWDVE